MFKVCGFVGYNLCFSWSFPTRNSALTKFCKFLFTLSSFFTNSFRVFMNKGLFRRASVLCGFSAFSTHPTIKEVYLINNFNIGEL